jgi:hypothetical protein
MNIVIQSERMLVFLIKRYAGPGVPLRVNNIVVLYSYVLINKICLHKKKRVNNQGNEKLLLNFKTI